MIDLQELGNQRVKDMYKANQERSFLKTPKGVNEDVVRFISKEKNEPEWMLNKRLEALKLFNQMKMPTWGPDLSKLDLQDITYYSRSDEQINKNNWDELPDDIKKTFDKLGIPKAEQKELSGAGAQYESEVVYHNLKEEWARKGVIFENCDIALHKYPELFKKHFMTSCVPINDHKLAALHAAVWSGGTFIYVPPGVKVNIPLQAYFRMNAQSLGQFEHTLIVVDEGAECHYIEGCFTEGNIVTTNPDYKQIQDIQEGEHVLTSEGTFKKTKDMQHMPYTGNLVTIQLYGDNTQCIEVTEEHPFLYVDRSKKNEKNTTFTPRWNMPKFFNEKDYLVVPINQKIDAQASRTFIVDRYKSNKQPYKEKLTIKMTDEFFRLVGYYLAEGSITNNFYLNFSFRIHEHDLISDVKHCIQKVFGPTKILEMKHEKNNGVSLVICSATLARVFSKLGTTCDKKSLLPWMMYETKQHQAEIIKGWFRGDGNYFNKRSVTSGFLKESFRINTTSHKLLLQARDILLRLGIVGFMNSQDRSKTKRKTMFTLGVTGSFLKPFGDLVGINVQERMNGRKRASMFDINEKFAFLPIRKIKRRSVENHPVYNFGVENHQTYTVGGVAVHNCSAPLYSKNSLHAGCVEIFVAKNARCRYSSVENWSKNTYNLNTKRALVEDDGMIEWINGNVGSGCTMLYPCSVLRGNRSKSDSIGIAFAGPGQHQDTGMKVYHIGKNTSSTIVSKSISCDGGFTGYRGMLKVAKNAKNTKSHVECDALMIGSTSRTDTIPYIEVQGNDIDIGHEATVGKVSGEQLFYLTSRGLSEEQAMQMIVSGFIEPVIKQLPLEYAAELNKLIQLEMEGSVG